MGHIRNTFHVDAPVERVWELGAQCDRFPEWQVGIVEVRDCAGPIDHVGASYTVVYKSMGRKLDALFEVTKAEKPRLVEERVTAAGGGHGASSLRLEPADGGTDVTYEFDYELPGGFFGDVADKLFMERAIDRDLKHSNENFKALCESKVPANA